MGNWQSGDLKVNGLRLHYTRTGGHGPQVVLAHGFSDDGLCWTPVAQALASEYDLVMVDARGHGRSDGPEQGYGSAEHAGDLAGLISGLGLQRPAVLGHSMGAATALALATTYPDLPGAILLEDPPPLWAADFPSGPGEEGHAQMRAWITDLKRKTREELIAEQRIASPSWSEAELGPWADSKLRFSLNVLNPPGEATVDWPAILPRVTCPALLITADPARGALITGEGAAALQAMIPQLRVVHIPEAGHSIRREQFARYLDSVRTFLAEVTASEAG
jgi:N-formylmaleamate deformylase